MVDLIGMTYILCPLDYGIFIGENFLKQNKKKMKPLKKQKHQIILPKLKEGNIYSSIIYNNELCLKEY
jgi:hypothetical protein